MGQKIKKLIYSFSLMVAFQMILYDLFGIGGDHRSFVWWKYANAAFFAIVVVFIIKQPQDKTPPASAV